MVEDWQHGGFGVYVHWPFCQSKCPYCDFNSHISTNIDQKRWFRAFLSEIERAATPLSGRLLGSIYFGGGTPSLMEPWLVGGIVEALKQKFIFANDVEITLEANPTSVEAGRFRAYHEAGVNRISMGIQALNDADLRRLGRLHSVSEAQTAFETARNIFDRVSFDLIYARQDQSLDQWRQELQQALSMAVDHLSLYQLTIEPGTAFGDRFAKGGLAGLPSEDLGADMYELTQVLCESAGMPAYETSNHAAAGSESRHNLVYWSSGDYLGIGPGAHGRLTIDGKRHSTETYLTPGKWLEAVENSNNGQRVSRVLDPFEAQEESLMMGLRLRTGIDEKRFFSVLVTKKKEIEGLKNIEMLESVNGFLRTTPQGRPVLNAILRELLAG